MGETPEYTKRAIQNYNNKFDRVAVNLPKGSKDRIRELTGMSCNKYISKLVAADLERIENAENLQEQQPEPDGLPFPE